MKTLPITLAMAFQLTAANAATVGVHARCNIFDSGRAAATDGLLPTRVALPAGTGRILSLANASGQTYSDGGGTPRWGPDGFLFSSDIKSVGGLSGLRSGRSMGLVGVFLTDAEPAEPAPGLLDFTATGVGTAFTTLTPLVGQIFFIGDGLTGTASGTPQRFVVPDSATRLFLGFADGPNFKGPPGGYGDNVGSLTINYQVAQSAAPQPGTASGDPLKGVVAYVDRPGRSLIVHLGPKLGERTVSLEGVGVFDEADSAVLESDIQIGVIVQLIDANPTPGTVGTKLGKLRLVGLRSQATGAIPSPVAPPPSTAQPSPEPFKKGDRVSLIRNEPLYFQQGVLRTGNRGEIFSVAAYDAKRNVVFVLAKNTLGKEIALNVSANALRLADSTIAAPKPQLNEAGGWQVKVVSIRKPTTLRSANLNEGTYNPVAGIVFYVVTYSVTPPVGSTKASFKSADFRISETSEQSGLEPSGAGISSNSYVMGASISTQLSNSSPAECVLVFSVPVNQQPKWFRFRNGTPVPLPASSP